MIKLNNSWDQILSDQFKSDYFVNLLSFLKNEYSNHCVYPDFDDIFNTLKFTDFNDVKVVIIGQDPYHGANQAHGLCFSVKEGVKPPPSLVNIYKEQKADLNINQPKNNGHLTCWAKQGVLMLNAVLTVREGTPNSHKNKGWEKFTDHIIKLLNKRTKPIVFLLWGANARAKKSLITNDAHLILEAVHPSPLSAFNGFFGCRHFSKTNEFLISNNMTPIDWQLPINSIKE